MALYPDLPSWEDTFDAVRSGKLGSWEALRIAATNNLTRVMREMGADGQGITSSDINHTLYTPCALALRDNKDDQFVLDYLAGGV